MMAIWADYLARKSEDVQGEKSLYYAQSGEVSFESIPAPFPKYITCSVRVPCKNIHAAVLALREKIRKHPYD